MIQPTASGPDPPAVSGNSPSARMIIPFVAVRGILALMRERSAGRRGASSGVGEA